MCHRNDLLSHDDSDNTDIVVLTETCLFSHIDSSEMFSCSKRFNVYRFKRGEKTGGCVLIAVAEHGESFTMRLTSALKITWICLHMNHEKSYNGSMLSCTT